LCCNTEAWIVLGYKMTQPHRFLTWVTTAFHRKPLQNTPPTAYPNFILLTEHSCSYESYMKLTVTCRFTSQNPISTYSATAELHVAEVEIVVHFCII
jgi:hypothetical protein